MTFNNYLINPETGMVKLPSGREVTMPTPEQIALFRDQQRRVKEYTPILAKMAEDAAKGKFY